MPKRSAVQISYTLSSDDEESTPDDIRVKEEPISDEDIAQTETPDDESLSTEIKSEPQNEDSQATNKGLASVMAQILNKKTVKKNAILAKAKTDKQISLSKKRKAENEHQSDSVKVDPDDFIATQEKLRKRKLWENMNRVKPDVLEREKERSLQRIATRGVVQLFNAVKQQQKNVEDRLKEVGSSVRKQDQVLESMTKGQFVDVLKEKAGKDKSSTPKLKPKKEVESDVSDEETAGKPSWNILRDDFMMGAKMKDWDKASDSEGEGHADDDLEDDDTDYSDT